MKKHILSLLALLLSYGVHAQTDSCTSEFQDTISFSLPYRIVTYAEEYCQGAQFDPLRAAIAMGTTDHTGMDDQVTIVLKEYQVYDVFMTLSGVSEGLGADYNAILKNAMLARLPGRPCLAARVMEELQVRQKILEDISAAGARKLAEIRAMFGLN